MSRTFAMVGSWHYRPSTRGYAAFRYDADTADMELVEHTFPHVSAGAQAVDAKRCIAYVCDERGSRRDEVGGGGYVLAVGIDPETGRMRILNEKESLAPQPSYICLDKSGEYAIVVHHCDGGHVTKIQKDARGQYVSAVHFDDAAVVLFRIGADGSLGDCEDVFILMGDGRPGLHMQAKLHSIVADPTGEVFMICDKGADKVYAFGIDRERGKLEFRGELVVPDGYSPRYGVFHPSLPIFYFDNEKAPLVLSASYAAATGDMKLVEAVSLLPEEGKYEKAEASDIVIRSNGRNLYVSERTNNLVSAFAVDETGALSLLQTVPCGGANPRGLCLSPDEKYLFCANSDTDSITRFQICGDGTLREAGPAIRSECPANIRFLTV